MRPRRYDHSRAWLLKRFLIFFVFLGVSIAILAVVSGIVDKKASNAEKAEDDLEDTVRINGKYYEMRSDIFTCLFIGEDARGKKASSSEYNGTGQSDVLQLLVFDKTNQTYVRIPINRDTMTDVKSLDEDGSYLATTKIQISYAHANGDGMEVSCENTADAVSALFSNIKIDRYFCLDMDGIKTINHMAGGVPVTIRDDFSRSDPSLKMGKAVTLNDDQAYHFVHDRMNVADGTNANRMKRQEVYMKGLSKILEAKSRADSEFPFRLYKELEDYRVSDLSAGDISRIAKAVLSYENLGVETIDGENKEGADGYVEFHADKESLNDLLVKYFLEPRIP